MTGIPTEAASNNSDGHAPGAATPAYNFDEMHNFLSELVKKGKTYFRETDKKTEFTFSKFKF